VALKKSPHRIVIIEDNPADTVLLRHALDEQGEPYILEVLTDGESALKFIRDHCRNCRPEPCLIVLDLHLPRYDGATVLRAIRSEPEMARVSVVVLTSTASPEEKAEVIALGIQAYRMKPMSYDQTLELARELIGICNQSSERTTVQRT
jgi:two-component system response regulator